MKGILLDVEGTTTPIGFVTGVLFPFAREHVAAFVRHNLDSAELRPVFEALRKEREADLAAGSAPPAWSNDELALSVSDYARWLIDRDRKSTPLKALQGRIWDEGYRGGTLAGQVFDDVPTAFERWSARGVSISIFSSGSVLAQKLLFSTCAQGDLTRFLARHFDTTTGPKNARASYVKIVSACGGPADEMLFVSDVAAELDAARAAGMQTRMCVRPGNAREPGHGHAEIASFDSLA